MTDCMRRALVVNVRKSDGFFYVIRGTIASDGPLAQKAKLGVT